MNDRGPGARSPGTLKGTFDAWNVVFAAAGLVGGVLAAFLVPPPFDVGPTEMLPAVGKFVVAVVIAAVIAPKLRYSSHRHSPRWSALSVVTLLAGLAVLFWYLSLSSQFVRHHQRADGKQIQYVISSSYSPTGQRIYDQLHSRTKYPPSSEDMIKHASGNTFEERRYSIWDRDAVTRVELLLGAVYLCLFVALGALIIFAAQAWRTGTAKS